MRSLYIVPPPAQESSGLDRFNVEYMYAPMGTDMLLGASKQKQLIMWQYNHMGAYRWAAGAALKRGRVLLCVCVCVGGGTMLEWGRVGRLGVESYVRKYAGDAS